MLPFQGPQQQNKTHATKNNYLFCWKSQLVWSFSSRLFFPSYEFQIRSQILLRFDLMQHH